MESTTPSSPSMASGLPQQPRTGNASGEPLSSSPRSGDSTAGRPSDISGSFSDAADSSVLRHPKGKRKRTAAKDKSILEAAYLANPKPDKTARLDIVSQVSLNEKEVQIWFQNRRQNDRRKSRPLSAQEIAALRFGGIHALSSDPLPPYASHSVSMHASFPDGHLSSSPPSHPQFSSASLAAAAPSTTPLSSPELGPWMPEALARKQAEEQQQQRERAVETPSASHSFSSSTGSVGYLANRWNMHSSFSTPASFGGSLPGSNSRDSIHDGSVKLELFGSASATPVLPPLTQEHRPNLHSRPFRLSMSLDGKAEVISSQSPSPPRLPPPQPSAMLDRRTGSSGGSSSSNGSESPLPSLPAIRRSGLNRSHSALPGLGFTLPPISNLTGALGSGSAEPSPLAPSLQPAFHPPRLLRGRSRDVHAWESVCDAETRLDDELSAQAQHEISGSAIAAISLLRSTSTGAAAASPSSILQPNGTKRNTPTRSGMVRPGAKRAKLGRASSSVARMQSDSWREDMDKVWMDDEKKKKLKLSTLLSGNDSDKENWSPDEEGNPMTHVQRPNGRRPLPSARGSQQHRNTSRILGDGEKHVHSRATSDVLATRHTGSKAGASPFDGLEIFEDSASEGGHVRTKRAQLSRASTLPGTDDVAKLLHSDNVSPSKKGDLDCVAGLLSLSQGNWR